jgi:phage tail sheath protein FI
MPVNLTYPGIYIEELPSSTRTITAAPTSIAVVVGYTHPFKTKNFNKAVRVFNFTEYEREFGGFYQSDVVTADVAYAIEQFFLNGGSDAYVVGLDPDLSAAEDTLRGILFKALEPTDLDTTHITVTISNVQSSNPSAPPLNDIADITVVYGSSGLRAETFRQVTLDKSKPNFLEKRINGVSTLVKVAPGILAPPAPASYPTAFSGSAPTSITLSTVPGASVFTDGPFLKVFKDDHDLDKVPIFNLLLIPGVADNTIWTAALIFCERKQAFLILDPPKDACADTSSDSLNLMETLMLSDAIVPKSTNGAIYFPYLKSTNPLTGNPIELPPSGFVAGIYARTDSNRGVWKAPAGLETVIMNTTGVVERGKMTDPRQGTLNIVGVNCLRAFPGIDTVVYGARTLVSSNPARQQWKYVPVRRIALFIEQTLLRNLGWVVFEPNDEPLWAAIRTSIQGFMLSLFTQGAFQGSTPSQAFQVKCDKSTTTQQDIDNGIVNIVVAFAPLKPAEFVIVKIAQLAGQVQA